MTKKERRALNVVPEIREDENGRKLITGYAVRWNELSNPIWGVFREQFASGAFKESIQERMNEIFATWQHNTSETIGRSPNTLQVREDEVGLYFQIDPPDWAQRHVESIERGDVRGASFIFEAQVAEYDYDSDPEYVIRTVKRAILYEVAPVSLPAYPQSSVGVRSDQDLAEEIRQAAEKRKADLLAKNKQYLARQQALREVSIKL